MAELTYLNEPSVVHNLYTRYQADSIYVSDQAAHQVSQLIGSSPTPVFSSLPLIHTVRFPSMVETS